MGKTALIKSIVQVCEDIVHVDPLASDVPTLRKDDKGKKPAASRELPTQQVTEIFASTKTYPPWWSEVEDSSVLRRRKSGGESVLERNICFVDTPGFDTSAKDSDYTSQVLEYVEEQMFKQLDLANLSDADVQRLLGGQGGSQVDLVLYLMTKGMSLHYST